MSLFIYNIGRTVYKTIKTAPWFPFASGKLRDEAFSNNYLGNNTTLLKFDSEIAPYVEYLEEGTEPHDIPHAFGRDLPFGIGGRFKGKFHPGSYIHQGFIKNNCVNTIIDYICNKYGGVCDDRPQ